MGAGSITMAVIFFSIFIYVWYRIIKWILKFLKNAKNYKGDTSDKFVDEQPTPKLTSKFDYIVNKLELERLAAKKKTDGLFKRSFLRTWLLMAGTSAILTIALTTGEVGPVAIIMPSIMAAFIAAIGSGIYALIKKGTSLVKFTAILKKELVSKIVKHVNPELTFFEEGISEDEFRKAELFYGSSFKSEDTIKGSIDGQPVVISECTSYYSGGEGVDTTCFNGIFVQLELTTIYLSTPLKIIPTFAIESNFKKLKIKEEDLITLPNSIEKLNYGFFCKDKQAADSFINPVALKILDFIFDKYETKRGSIFEDTSILKGIDLSRGVYISIVENKLYLAMDWSQDMFEPDKFLNKNLVESGFAERIYKDLLFMNQVVKEVNLLNKAS